MGYRSVLLVIAVMVMTSLLLFRLYEQELSRMWLNLAIHPEILDALALATEDQRLLADLDPRRKEIYRGRFDKIQALRNNLVILEHNREELASHFKYALWLLFGLIVAAASIIHWLSQGSLHRRIQALRKPLTELAEGRFDIVIPGKRGDTIGKIAAMIEQTSQLLARQREKLRYMEHLTNWQEAARRNAHEIRTPLTAAQMEVEQLMELEDSLPSSQRESLKRCTISIMEELDRLKRFTQEFTAFAKIRRPNLEPLEFRGYLVDFAELFGRGWNNLTIELNAGFEEAWISGDKEMIRQVLVNLCNNSSMALADRCGQIILSIRGNAERVILDVVDNGPGVAEKIVDRLFEPYATTREVGEGMGLGLPISRKIMLDHGGDLELLDRMEVGATFRLIFPRSTPGEKEEPA